MNKRQKIAIGALIILLVGIFSAACLYRGQDGRVSNHGIGNQ